MSSLEDVKSGDRRLELVALRDYLVHELEAHRCKTCQMSQLRTGDTAAIVTKLQQVLESLHTLPTEKADRLAAITRRRGDATVTPLRRSTGD